MLRVFQELQLRSNFQISQPGLRLFTGRVNINQAGADFDAEPGRDGFRDVH